MTQEKLPHRKELCLQSEGLVLYQTLSHTLKLAPHESPSRRTLNNYAIFYAKPSRKTLNKFGKPSTTLIIPFSSVIQTRQVDALT